MVKHIPLDADGFQESYGKDGKGSSKKNKLSYKQKLMKIFLTSDLKNKKLWKPLRTAKTDMIRNFHDGGFDAADVHTLFWVYFRHHKDVFIPNHLISRLAHYKVFLPDMPDDHTLTVLQYLSVLKHIRQQLHPLVKEILLLKTFAHKSTQRQMKDMTLNADIYTDFDREQEIEEYNKISQEKFAEYMKFPFYYFSIIYNQQRFDYQISMISNTWNEEHLQNFIIFAILGIHYFDRKGDVYDSFTPEQLQETVNFATHTNPLYHISLTLEEFLHIIEYLDFTTELFSF